jgi:hypothetical protein
MERAGRRARNRPKGTSKPRAHPRPKAPAGPRPGRQPEERAGQPAGPARRPVGLALAPKPDRALGASAETGRVAPGRAQPRETPASSERRDRDPPGAGSGEGPPAADHGPGTGLRRVRLVLETTARPRSAPARPGRSPLSALGPAGPRLPSVREPAGPVEREPGRIRPRPAVPRYPAAVRRHPAAVRRHPAAAPGYPAIALTYLAVVYGFLRAATATARHTGRVRHGRAGHASRTRSPLSNSTPRPGPSCTACRTT